MMMMSDLSSVSSAPRVTSTGLVASATGKNQSNSRNSSTAKLGVSPPAPQALTNDVFSPAISLKVAVDAPVTSSSATVETPEAKATKTSSVVTVETPEAKAEKTASTVKKSTTETKPVEKQGVDVSPEKIEKAKTIMADTETKFATEKDPAKAKRMLNDTYAELKALNLPKENLIVHAMQLDVWDAAIVNLLPANDKPALAIAATTSASAEKQTPAKDASTDADKSINLMA